MRRGGVRLTTSKSAQCYTCRVHKWRETGLSRRRFLLLNVALAAFALLACSNAKRPALKNVEPFLLAELALAPADLGGLYVVDSDRYLDQDGNSVPVPSKNFIRQLRVKDTTAAASPDTVATVILVTLDDQGELAATEFVDAADDQDVGPANLADYIQQRFPGSHDAHAELIEDFPTYDDATVANRLTWQQPVNGAEQTMKAYGVYIRSGGLLTLVALRAPADSEGNEPESLRHQAETVVHIQADKLTYPPASRIGPRTRSQSTGNPVDKE